MSQKGYIMRTEEEQKEDRLRCWGGRRRVIANEE